MLVRGGEGETVTCPVFKGENEADGTIQDRKNDQLENPSTSSDVDFRFSSQLSSRHNFLTADSLSCGEVK